MQNAKGLALVTGSSSGIGKAIALRLAKDGFHTLIHFNQNEAGAKDVQSQIEAAGGKADTLQFNVSDSTAVNRALDACAEKYPTFPFAALVNNAGVHDDSLLGIMSDQQFDRVMKTNVYGAFYLMRWCIKKMIRQRSGSIVNISSVSGQTGNAGQANYAASKAGLIAMTQSLAMEVGSRGIRVNSVAPGLIETSMIAEVIQLEEVKKRIPMGRFGTVDEVAGAVSFLCSEDSTYITGSTLSVNGGLYPT